MLDYDANVPDEDSLRSTLTDFIAILRENHPTIPVLVISKPAFVDERFDPQARSRRLARRDIQAGVVDDRRRSGDSQISFLDAGDVDFTDGTVDGIHPSDLGFLRLADAVEPALRHLLGHRSEAVI